MLSRIKGWNRTMMTHPAPRLGGRFSVSYERAPASQSLRFTVSALSGASPYHQSARISVFLDCATERNSTFSWYAACPRFCDWCGLGERACGNGL
jgi:hypothetical protein